MKRKNTNDAILAILVRLDKLIEQVQLTNALLAAMTGAGQPLKLAYDWKNFTVREPDKTIAAWEFVPKAVYKAIEEEE